MPQYKVLAKSYINGSLVEEGAVVEYDGQPGKALELIEEDKPKRGGRKAAAPAQAEAGADVPEGEDGE